MGSLKELLLLLLLAPALQASPPKGSGHQAGSCVTRDQLSMETMVGVICKDFVKRCDREKNLIISEMEEELAKVKMEQCPGPPQPPAPTRALLTGNSDGSSMSCESYPGGCSVPSLPSYREGHTTFLTTGGQVASCGGLAPSGYLGELSTCILLTSGEWQEGVMGDLPEPRVSHAAVTLDAGVYLLGGSSTSTTSAFLDEAAVAAGSLVWTRGPGLPQEMSTPCATRISSTSFMMIHGTSVREFSTATAGPTSSLGWRPASTWPTLRTWRQSWPGCAVLGNTLVIAGGWSSIDGSITSTTELINLQTGSLAWGPSMESRRKSFHLLVLHTPAPRLLALGGTDGSRWLESVEELVGSTAGELVAGSWRQVDPLEGTRARFGAVVVENDSIC